MPNLTSNKMNYISDISSITEPTSFAMAVYGAENAKNPIVIPVRLWATIQIEDVDGVDVELVGMINARRFTDAPGFYAAPHYVGEGDLLFLGYAFSQNEVTALHAAFKDDSFRDEV